MCLFQKSAIFVSAFLPCFAFAQKNVPPDLYNFKSDDGLIIRWQLTSTDATTKQIEISDALGNLRASLNVLRPVPEARRVTIYDVSARGKVIAVAAVYENKAGNRQVRPVASILLFDFSGQLLSAVALDPSRVVALLTVDDKFNIWTLTDGAGPGIDPSSIPMVVEYSAEGKILRELLRRSTFPLHALSNRGNNVIGWPAMGYDSGVVWFWLPGSTDLITISTNDAKISMTKMQLQKKTGRHIVLLAMGRESAGNLIAEVREDDDQGGYEVAYFSWAGSASSWMQFKPGACDGARFIGTGDGLQVYMRLPATDICTFTAN